MDSEDLDERDAAIWRAHEHLSAAIQHLDKATIHAMNVGDDTHVAHIAGIMRELCAAREPLSEHIDWVAAHK